MMANALQMLPALKALHEHGIFSASEVKQIYKTRSDFERRLVARIARKEDYLRYIEYETRLEKLRSVRWDRISELPRILGDSSLIQSGQNLKWTRWRNTVSHGDCSTSTSGR
jgi:U3 small nucleolar RNA-associated protein 6